MTPPPIIECFDIGKNGRLYLLPVLKLSTINQFGFQARKEALHDGIVPTIPRPAHGTLQAVPCEPLLVLFRRILATAIRVMEQRPHDLPLVHGHREARVRQRGRDACPLAQPPSRREYKSNSTATYSHPSRVATNVMSLAHFWFGWVAVNCRCNTFSARTSDDTEWNRQVVRRRQTPRTPLYPRWCCVDRLNLPLHCQAKLA